MIQVRLKLFSYNSIFAKLPIFGNITNIGQYIIPTDKYLEALRPLHCTLFNDINITLNLGYPKQRESKSCCFFKSSMYINLLHAVTNGLGVFSSPIPITSFPDSRILVANLVKSLSLEIKQNPSTFIPTSGFYASS